MKHKPAIAAFAGLAALVTGCGGGNDGAPAPPPPVSSNQALDTAQVLALARQSSETNSPFPVNAGALTLTDTSDTTEPISVNAM